MGPLPGFICISLLKNYQLFYIEQLGRLERDEYFQLNRTKEKPLTATTNLIQVEDEKSSKQNNPNVNTPAQKDLVSYYDLLMAIAAHKSKTSLESVEYRSCIWEHSTLETRLEQSYNAAASRGK